MGAGRIVRRVEQKLVLAVAHQLEPRGPEDVLDPVAHRTVGNRDAPRREHVREPHGDGNIVLLVTSAERRRDSHELPSS